MDAMTAIMTRRSIRQYTDEPVTEDVIEELLKAAMMAPSAGDEQPWHFVVIRARAVLDEIARVHPHAGMVTKAPVAILVCGDIRAEQQKGFWVQDCSAATQNLLLAAHARDLGAVWLGVYPRGERVEAIRKLVGLPDHVFPLALVPLGYPAEKKPQPQRYDKSKIRYNRW